MQQTAIKDIKYTVFEYVQFILVNEYQQSI